MKKNYKIALAFILGILVSGTSVYAATKYLASEVTYKGTTVEKALNELYNKSGSSCDASLVGTTWNFNYSGQEDIFVAPCNGTYKLEAWGAQGGNSSVMQGGYGGYSIGHTNLNNYEKLFINVGGQGSVTSTTVNQIAKGGYNGGGNGYNHKSTANIIATGGGGATHISTSSGLLSSLESKKESILIVSGGGGGTWKASDTHITKTIGHGGGYVGNNGTGYSGTSGVTFTANGGKQEIDTTTATYTNGAFGLGGSANPTNNNQSGGAGGGYYGGSVSFASTGGGSGYIGNSKLTKKSMYCYNCTESSEENTKTISTTNVSDTPTSNYAKKGHGYAKITLVSLK